MVTFALLGLPRVAPAFGWDNATVNDLLPRYGAALLTATEKFFAAESPSAHVKVPLAAVKSVPATAVPPVVA